MRGDFPNTIRTFWQKAWFRQFTCCDDLVKFRAPKLTGSMPPLTEEAS